MHGTFPYQWKIEKSSSVCYAIILHLFVLPLNTLHTQIHKSWTCNVTCVTVDAPKCSSQAYGLREGGRCAGLGGPSQTLLIPLVGAYPQPGYGGGGAALLPSTTLGHLGHYLGHRESGHEVRHPDIPVQAGIREGKPGPTSAQCNARDEQVILDDRCVQHNFNL